MHIINTYLFALVSKGQRQCHMDSDNECGEPLDRKSNEDSSDHMEDSEISRDEVPPKQADGLDWEELGEEFRNLFKFNAEKRTWQMIVKTSLIIFATSLAPSLFDMGSDALSTYNFINGTTYTKYVPDLNHPSVNSSQCVHVGTHLQWDGNSSEVVYKEFECFEGTPSGDTCLLSSYSFLVLIVVWSGRDRRSGSSQSRQLDCSILETIGRFLQEDVLM